MNLVTNISLTLYIQGLQLLCHHTEVTGDNSKSEENIATSSFHLEDNERMMGGGRRERERVVRWQVFHSITGTRFI